MDTLRHLWYNRTMKCKEKNCESPVQARGLCNKHYMREYRSSRGECSFINCYRPIYAKKVCESHYKKDLRGRNPEYDLSQRAVDKKTKDLIDPAYHRVHNRLRYHKGSPSNHQCEDCGNTASSWSLSTFVNVEYGIKDRRTYPYSLNLNDYRPRCYPCHGQFDKIPASN
jgi:hypothetical protein